MRQCEQEDGQAARWAPAPRQRWHLQFVSFARPASLTCNFKIYHPQITQITQIDKQNPSTAQKNTSHQLYFLICVICEICGLAFFASALSIRPETNSARASQVPLETAN